MLTGLLLYIYIYIPYKLERSVPIIEQESLPNLQTNLKKNLLPLLRTKIGSWLDRELRSKKHGNTFIRTATSKQNQKASLANNPLDPIESRQTREKQAMHE